ncbi:hypothetical protein [Agaribacterium haliotis]|uniref:hypothetical protein n=1 Tax=Agaribacterium haliotis TaxID=2013869 RepID=UPI0011776371|nr:hypothetical protein [Agaribacterium haliotis]
MKSVLIFLLLPVSMVLNAQEPLEEGEVIMINPKHPSEDCEGIFKEVSKPSLPASISAQHTIAKHGACSVTISFTVLKNGQLDSYEIDDVQERCKPFIDSSVIALKTSSFRKQDINKYCYHTYTYKFE